MPAIPIALFIALQLTLGMHYEKTYHSTGGQQENIKLPRVNNQQTPNGGV